MINIIELTIIGVSIIFLLSLTWIILLKSKKPNKIITKELLISLGCDYYEENSCSSRFSYQEGFYSVPNSDFHCFIDKDNEVQIGTFEYFHEIFTTGLILKNSEEVISFIECLNKININNKLKK